MTTWTQVLLWCVVLGKWQDDAGWQDTEAWNEALFWTPQASGAD